MYRVSPASPLLPLTTLNRISGRQWMEISHIASQQTWRCWQNSLSNRDCLHYFIFILTCVVFCFKSKAAASQSALKIVVMELQELKGESACTVKGRQWKSLSLLACGLHVLKANTSCYYLSLLHLHFVDLNKWLGKEFCSSLVSVFVPDKILKPEITSDQPGEV